MESRIERQNDGIPPIHSYPEGPEDVPHRPTLSKRFAQFVYDPNLCPEMHNSVVWTTEYRIRSMLPLEETYALLSKQCGSLLKMSKESTQGGHLLKPDIMCDFITELLENNTRATLKSRWKENYPKIMEAYRFLFFRVSCRRRIMALHYGDQPKDPKSVSTPLIFDTDTGSGQKQELQPTDSMEGMKQLSEIILKYSFPA